MRASSPVRVCASEGFPSESEIDGANLVSGLDADCWAKGQQQVQPIGRKARVRKGEVQQSLLQIDF